MKTLILFISLQFCVTILKAQCAVTLAAGSNNNQTVNTGVPITNIIYTLGAAATNATIAGLPTGVIGIYNNGRVTISGTPSVTGTFTYTLNPVGCASPPVNGTITVNALTPTPTNANSYSASFIGTSFNTAFNLPAMRFNINKFSGDGPFGTIEAFSSLGAGVGISYGKVHITSTKEWSVATDDDKTITQKNIIGIYFGVLFSSSNNTTSNRTIFAPNVSLQLLDFQIGYGYELGTVANTAYRSILTISYSIPLTKLSNTGSYLFDPKDDKKIKNNIAPTTKMDGLF